MALVTNRRNSAAYARGFIVGGAEAWDSVRLNTFRNIYASEAGIDDKTGIPNGYNTGGILLPLKPGGMGVHQEAARVQVANADAKLGFPITASSTITLTVANAQADQIVSLVASGTLQATTSASLSAGVQAVASSSMSVSANATLGGIIPVSASASCALTPSVVVSALAFMDAEAGGPTPLSPEGLARAVWSEEMTDYNDVGTFGEQLKNLSVSGGGPSAATIADAVWDEAINAHLTAGSAGRFINDLAVELEKRLKTTVFLANK